MKRFGNVSRAPTSVAVRSQTQWRLTRDAINGGTSSSFFQKRSALATDASLNFRTALVRVAQQLEITIVPVSIVGSIQPTAPATGCSGPPPSPCTCTTTHRHLWPWQRGGPGCAKRVRDLLKVSVERVPEKLPPKKSPIRGTKTIN